MPIEKGEAILHHKEGVDLIPSNLDIVYFETGDDFRTGMLNTRYIKTLENGVGKAHNDDYRVIVKTSYADNEVSLN